MGFRDLVKQAGVRELSRTERDVPVGSETVEEGGIFRTYEVCVRAMEIVFEWQHPLLRKVVYCLPSFESLVVDGVLNPVFHASCCVTVEGDFDLYPVVIDEVRAKVSWAFSKHFGGVEFGRLKFRGKVLCERKARPDTWRDRGPTL